MAKISKKNSRNPQDAVPDEISFGGFAEGGILSPSEPMTQAPSVDVYSTPAEIIVEVEAPGVKRDDLDISFYKDTLTVKGVKRECMDDGKVNYVCMERSFGRIFRTIEMPFPVDSSRIKASYKNGILTVRVPRVEDKRCVTRKVPVEPL
ncbi:MAG: Hsp20/alpha crystallin family protein [Deltaproteobacteria bacterium]|nr:Hsp20/alpha crystallin family protein [Deltaproteobacteria bacterium]